MSVKIVLAAVDEKAAINAVCCAILVLGDREFVRISDFAKSATGFVKVIVGYCEAHKSPSLVPRAG